MKSVDFWLSKYRLVCWLARGQIGIKRTEGQAKLSPAVMFHRLVVDINQILLTKRNYA